LAAGVVVAISAMALFVYVNGATSAESKSNENANVAKVRRGTVTTTEAASGTVQAAHTRGLSFATSGTVTEIAVQEGDRVSAGQVLARIDDADAGDAVSNAESDVSAAETQLDEAESASASAGTGTNGSVACTATDAGYHRSASPTPSASSAASPTPPAASSAVSPSSSGSRAATSSAPGTGALPGGGASVPGGTSGSCGGATGSGRGGGSDSVYSAQTQLNNAREKLAEAERQLAGTVIRTPVDGRVTAVNGTVGAEETPGATAFITLAATGVVVQAQFSEADVAALAVGQPVAITLAGRTTTFSGTVSTISPAGAASGQLVRYAVMVALEQAPQDLLYGQAANTVVTTGTAADVLYVPSSAVTDESAGTGTVVVRKGGHDHPQTVQIGLRGDQYTEIRSGLLEGSDVVLAGSR
jgi:HlyD family secretion protein